MVFLTGVFTVKGAGLAGPAAISKSTEHSLEKDWPSSTPEEQGMDSKQLLEVFDFVKENDINIHSLTLIRNGHTVLDACFFPNSRGTVHDVASVTKSITSILIGIAVDKGYIKSIHQPVLDFFPERKIENLDEHKKRLTIENLLTMTTGFDYSYDGELHIVEMRGTEDWVGFLLNRPILAEPGKEFVYYTGGTHILSAIITQSTGRSELDFAREHLFGPLGISELIWPADPHGNNTGGWDLHMHPRDMAKIGFLFLNEGKWKNKQVVPKEWVKKSTLRQSGSSQQEGYGYLWWRFPDFFEARGRGGQRIVVIPEENIVFVCTASQFEPRDILGMVMRAVRSQSSLPENPEAYKRLCAKVQAAAGPPDAQPVPALPPAADEISGRTYIFDQNPYGFESFSLSFKNKSEAVLRLKKAGRESTDLIGLDGVYRISDSGSTRFFELPAARKGSWTKSRLFDFLVNEFADNIMWNIRISFEKDRAAWTIDEVGGFFHAALSAEIQ